MGAGRKRKEDCQIRRTPMILQKLGLMILLTGATGWAQQPPQPAQPPQPLTMQAPQQVPVTEAEHRRYEEILARRQRGEQISPEDQRFAQEIRARMNQFVRPVAVPQQIPATDAERRRFDEVRARRDRGEPISAADQRFAQDFMARTNQFVSPAAAPQMTGGMTSLERALGGPGGKWWTRPEMAQKLGLTTDQIKKMDDIFQQHRLKLIDLDAAVRKEEVIMEPLISAEQPDDAKIVAQIDKVAQARAELEKANARMLLGIRRLLILEQWNKLKSQPVTAPQAVRR
jgi:Spy/CpxP family protein refolding chaperone/ribosome assembly protein YihI (activator of Der GTPase)